MTEIQTKAKSDLGVRTVSAVVMVAVAGVALWLGGWWWDIFVAAVAITCLWEFVVLILKATSAHSYRVIGVVLAFVYIFLAAFELMAKRSAWAGEVDSIGSISVITVLGIVVLTDVGAYFSGRAIGGPKIAPRISPKKTWAGLLGGMIAASIWSMCAVSFAYSYENLANYGWALTYWGIPAAFVGAGLAVIAQGGDFFESWLKRKAGVKDSSSLIPGHGGVFDRVDGMLAVLVATNFFHFGIL